MRAGDPEPPFGRLVRVGIAAERDRTAFISFLAQFRRKQRRRARLVKDAGLEIETGRQAKIRMARTGIAVDAAVLAAAIRVDRAVKPDIRRVVAGDDRARRIDGELGFEPRRLVVLGMLPAVVEGDPFLALEAACLVARGAASLARLDGCRHMHELILPRR